MIHQARGTGEVFYSNCQQPLSYYGVHGLSGPGLRLGQAPSLVRLVPPAPVQPRACNAPFVCQIAHRYRSCQLL